MSDIDEETFLKKWKEACEGKKEKNLVENWSNKNIRSYIILGEKGCKNKSAKEDKTLINDLSCKESVVELIKDSFSEKLELHQEYYAADVIYYYKADNISNDSVWLNHIKIHLEHENEISESLEEISQLQTEPGDLNVLVTYPTTREKNSREEKIKEYKNKINEKFDKKLLIIFGELSPDGNSIIWTGYKLSKTFVEL